MHPHPSIEPEGTFAGLRPGAILLGAIADLALTLLASWMLLAWLAPDAIEAGSEALRERIPELNANPTFVVATVVCGSLATLFGGCLGALRAGRLFVRHGGWVAVTGAIFSAFFLLTAPPSETPEVPFPFWAEVLSIVLILPSGLAGGALARALASERSGGP